MLRRSLSWAIPLGTAAALLFLFNYCAPLQAGSLAVYAGITLAAAGALSLIKPLRILHIGTRRQAAAVALAGVAAAAAGLLWPAGTIRAAGRHTALDDVMPEYQFYERHTLRVHASPDRTIAAMREVTFGELGVYEALMRVRAAASGRFQAKPGLISRKPILAALQGGGSGFLPLTDDGRELVVGMAGRPWAYGSQPKLRTLEDFRAFHAPGSVRIAFNVRVEDEGGGWSRVSTETRVQATDQAAARTMARYWRLIYPGSGIMRRMWLNATRARAE